MNTKANVVS